MADRRGDPIFSRFWEVEIGEGGGQKGVSSLPRKFRGKLKMLGRFWSRITPCVDIFIEGTKTRNKTVGRARTTDLF